MEKCSICGKRFEGFGNNPSPFPGERCCDECDNKVVLPIRLFLAGTRNDQILVIHPSGVMTIVDEDADEVPLEELQSLVGGYIEVYPNRNERFVYIVNEEGLLMGLEPNGTAREILGIEAVGPVVVVPKELFK
jgi:hypothetical protein